MRGCSQPRSVRVHVNGVGRGRAPGCHLGLPLRFSPAPPPPQTHTNWAPTTLQAGVEQLVLGLYMVRGDNM